MRTDHGDDDNRRALIIVAHPDDEVIWAGGLMRLHPDWGWTVLSLCRADDADRAPKFRRVCKHLAARALISDLDDSNPLKAIDPAIDIGRRIVAQAGDRDWDLCITHGANGEYGHRRHVQVHTEVLRATAQNLLLCRRLWTFDYVCEPPAGPYDPQRPAAGPCAAAADADVLVHLTGAQLAEKRHIIEEMYGYARDSFEVAACAAPEAFRRHEIEPRI